MTLASIFTDHMVFKANSPVRVFGKGKGKILIEFLDEKITHISDEENWVVELKEHSYGGPYTMRIILDEKEILLRDIYVGEVWLCLGQSNLEMVLFRTEYGISEAENSFNENLRFFTLPHRFKAEEELCGWHFQKTDGKDTPWQVCTPESAAHFSAIGYYVGKELQKNLGCAVGVINISWGGAGIETFICREYFSQSEALSGIIDDYNRMLDNLDWIVYNEEYGTYARDCENFYNSLDYDEIDQVTERGVRATAGMPPEKSGKLPKPGPYGVSSPGCLYDSMISRIVPFNLSGVIWYQGESSSEKDYCEKYLVLMKCLRERFLNESLPFYAIELASFSNYWDENNCCKEGRFVTENNWAFLREEQQKSTETGDNNYLVTSMGLGDLYDIHPIHKMELSHRISLKILRHTYGYNIYSEHPTFKSAEFMDDKVIVSLNNADGLYCRLPIEGVNMYLADDSLILQRANIIIQDNKLILFSDKVKKPAFVRYGFDFAYTGVHLYNKAGLPLSPFRAEKQEV